MNIEKLTIEEVASPLWLKLEKHLEHQIQLLREENDMPLDPDHTSHIRGAITAYKDLLELKPEET